MANDAFALSPMSASAALPTDADYEAISEAFMETSRGRWFLKEYARRNRNADTAMVLEAVARIESAVAAQNAAADAHDETARIDEVLTACRAVVEATRAAAEAAIAELDGGEGFTLSRKAMRIIREVAWRLREVGYDGRICDILEAQANAVDDNLGAALTQDLQQRVASAFAQALARLEAIARGEMTSEPAADGTASAMPENVVSLAALKSAATPAAVVEAEAPVATAAAEPVEPPAAALSIEDGMQPGAAVEATRVLAPGDAPAAALDIVPSAAPATDDSAQPLDTAAFEDAEDLRELAALAGETPAEAAEDESASSMPTGSAELQEEAPMTDEPAAASSSLSLGASLLARGMVSAPRPDPLAPLRRMTQAEKLAFFS